MCIKVRAPGEVLLCCLSLFCSILEQTVASELVGVLNVCKYCLVCLCVYEKKIYFQCACPDAEEINWFVFNVDPKCVSPESQ